jgi:hypothetical protein
MGLFKLDRGTTMRRRAVYVDRFGASIITFDLVFALTFIAGSIETLYPALAQNEVVFWATLVPLFLAMVWQWIEIRLAPHERIVVSMAGPNAETTWKPGDPDRRSGKERRRNPPLMREG